MWNLGWIFRWNEAEDEDDQNSFDISITEICDASKSAVVAYLMHWLLTIPKNKTKILLNWTDSNESMFVLILIDAKVHLFLCYSSDIICDGISMT